MNPIDELILKIEAYQHKVITKEYVLKHLRALQRHECEYCTQIPVYDMATFTDGYKLVKGGS